MTYPAHPYRAARRRRRGWTLIELLVVLTIISLLVAISIPITRMFTRNDLRDSARIINTMLRAARMYAMTFNVDTAVVYSLDYPFVSGPNGVEQFEPQLDSIFLDPGQFPNEAPLAVRSIRAAAIMYQLPEAIGARPLWPEGVSRGHSSEMRQVNDSAQAVRWDHAGTFVPTPAGGEFVPLKQGYSLLLVEPNDEFSTFQPTQMTALGTPVYRVDYGLTGYDPDTRYFLLDYNRLMEHWEPWDNQATPLRPSLEKIGMRPVYVYPLPMEAERDEAGNYRITYDRALIRPMIAHVFSPDGSLKTRLQYRNKERYHIFVAPDSMEVPEERVIATPGPGGTERHQALGITIEINRATGRTKVGS